MNKLTRKIKFPGDSNSTLILLYIWLCIFPVSLFGATNQQEPKSIRSRDNRAASSQSLIGLGPTFSFYTDCAYGKYDYGVQYSKLLGEMQSMQGSFRMGVPTRDGQGSSTDISAGGKTMSLQFDIQQFFRNSFFIRFGADLSIFQTELRKHQYMSGRSASEDTSAYLAIGDMSMTSISPLFGLGNQWTLNNGVVIGADWFSFRTSHIVISERHRAYSSTDEVFVNDEARKVRRSSHFVAPRFLLGYMF